MVIPPQLTAPGGAPPFTPNASLLPPSAPLPLPGSGQLLLPVGHGQVILAAAVCGFALGR